MEGVRLLGRPTGREDGGQRPALTQLRRWSVGLFALGVVATAAGLACVIVHMDGERRAELLGRSHPRRPLQHALLRQQLPRPTTSSGLARRLAFTQALGFSAHNDGKPEIHLETCGLLKRSCQHLVGQEKVRCGISKLCELLTSKDDCEAETGAACKQGASVKELRVGRPAGTLSLNADAVAP